MGSVTSTHAQAAPEAPKMTAEEMQLQQITNSMPSYKRPETFEERLYRKVCITISNQSLKIPHHFIHNLSSHT